MSSRIIVYAPGIHQGGGLILLNHLLSSLAYCNNKVLLMLDPRFQTSSIAIPDHIEIQLLKVGIFGRIKNEFKLWKEAKQQDHVLCFSNLPPFFKLKSTVSVYCQNRCVLQPSQLKPLSQLFYLRFWLQKQLMFCFKSHANEYIVQTPSMQRLLKPFVDKLGITIRIQPFWNQAFEYPRFVGRIPKRNNSLYNFIYPASEGLHKNHRRLIEAWILLANENYYPSLCLTIKHETVLWQWIQQKIVDYRLKIYNVGQVPYEKLQELYQKSECLIYPSILESLGLPLLEARCNNMPILAPELDYVRDVIDPEETFDPSSATSIAQAIKRWNEQTSYNLPIVSAVNCLTSIQYIQKFSANFVNIQ